MLFIIFHGSFGNPKENWIPYLKTNLTKEGHTVLTPKFPVDDWDQLTKRGPKTKTTIQNLNSWLKTFDSFYQGLSLKGQSLQNNNLIFIGHSIAPIFILSLVQKYNLQLKSAIFVSPFLHDLKKDRRFLAVNRTFYSESLKAKLNFTKLRRLIPKSHVLYSDNDPYVNPKYALEFAHKLNSQKTLIKNGGHLNASAGFTKFPLLLKLCQT